MMETPKQNPVPELQGTLIEKIGVEKHRESHAMALEACLVSFELCLTELRPIQAKILQMRKKVNTKLRGKINRKFKPNARQRAKEGRGNITAYWKEHATPIVQQMQERGNRLHNQLNATDNLYADLAQDGYAQLAEIIEEHSQVKTVSRTTQMYPIVSAWIELLTKLKALLNNGERLMPAIEQEILRMQQSLRASIAIVVPT